MLDIEQCFKNQLETEAERRRPSRSPRCGGSTRLRTRWCSVEFRWRIPSTSSISDLSTKPMDAGGMLWTSGWCWLGLDLARCITYGTRLNSAWKLSCSCMKVRSSWCLCMAARHGSSRPRFFAPWTGGTLAALWSSLDGQYGRRLQRQASSLRRW